MRRIFVRHGEPDYAHDCLTENGVIQAKCTAERLKDEPIKAIFSSPMGRARETASFTAEMHGLPIEVLDFMHEINWGEARPDKVGTPEEVPYRGHPWTLGYKLLTEYPGYVGSEEWDRHPFFKDNLCMDYYRMISEKFDEFLMRFGLLRKDGLYLCEKPCDDTIALFAHGGSGAVMFSHILSLPFPFTLTGLPYGVCSVSIVEFSVQGGKMVVPRLELFNDMAHVDKVRLEKLHFEK
ncbi:MAG: histidine phosphatase family protein [Lachnospiraceae bacterium]|nr:histidine phosphatase family protein [Lachnospiraceae bacterium]